MVSVSNARDQRAVRDHKQNLWVGGGPIGPPYQSELPVVGLLSQLQQAAPQTQVLHQAVALIGVAHALPKPSQVGQVGGEEGGQGADAVGGHGIFPLGLPHDSRCGAPAKGVQPTDKRHVSVRG